MSHADLGGTAAQAAAGDGSVSDADIVHAGVRGAVDLTPQPLPAGTHPAHLPPRGRPPALDSYAWKTGWQLGMRHTQIARAGYCLVARPGCTGLSSQFFKTASTGGQAWDFSRHRANAVVINLGANDIGHGVSGSAFQAAYTAETKAAVSARNTAGDAKVHYVDTTR